MFVVTTLPFFANLEFGWVLIVLFCILATTFLVIEWKRLFSQYKPPKRVRELKNVARNRTIAAVVVNSWPQYSYIFDSLADAGADNEDVLSWINLYKKYTVARKPVMVSLFRDLILLGMKPETLETIVDYGVTKESQIRAIANSGVDVDLVFEMYPKEHLQARINRINTTSSIIFDISFDDSIDEDEDLDGF